MDDEARENVETKTPQPVEALDAVVTGKKPRWAVIVSVILVSVLGYLFLPSFYYSSKAFKLELNCANKLRQIGECQLAYQGTNIYKVYGSLKNLQEGNFIEDKYTSYTFIKKYELEWEFYLDTATAEFQSEHPMIYSGDGYNTFAVVAYPRAFPKPLRTFAITEDQSLRVYNPANGNSYNNRDDPMVKTWDYY